MKEIRKEIDEVDGKILELLERRLELAKEVGRIKNEGGVQVEDSSREHEILKRAGKFEPVFREIVLVSKSVQMKSHKPISGEGKKIGVVGGRGRMGRWISELLQSSGRSIYCLRHRHRDKQ